METLEVDGIGFEVGGRAILRDVSLHVAPGETVALLGPSGSGKTTLLRMVAGLDRPTAGRVLFGGRDVTGVPAHRRGFGMMFQDHALFPHLDVVGNVEFGLRESGWDSARRATRRKEALALVGLEGFEKRTIEKLSGGERQRVALARTLAPRPALLMLDEPLGSLDRGLRERLADDLRVILSGLGVPALYVTHDQSEAFTVATTLAIMNSGRIVRTGTPREVWEHPRTEFVARFFGLENIVPAERLPQLAAAEAPAPLLLLRGEGARIATGPGPDIVSGKVITLRFQGAETEVQLDVGGASLSFRFPSGENLPRVGETAHIHVMRVQTLTPGDGSLL